MVEMHIRSVEAGFRIGAEADEAGLDGRTFPGIPEEVLAAGGRDRRYERFLAHFLADDVGDDVRHFRGDDGGGGDVVDLPLDGRAHRGRRIFRGAVELFQHGVHEVIILAAQVENEGGLSRDSVHHAGIAEEARGFQIVDDARIEAERIGGLYDEAACVEGAHAEIGTGAVALAAGDLDDHVACGGIVHGRGGLSEAAFLNGTDVHADEVVHIVHGAAVDHGDGAAAGLLRRLEEDLQLALFDEPFGDDLFRRGKKHGHMGVMAAEMSGMLRRAQRIHVGAEAEHRAGDAAVEDAHHAGGAADMGLHLIARSVEDRREVGGGLEFLHPHFRDGVEIVEMLEYSTFHHKVLLYGSLHSMGNMSLLYKTGEEIQGNLRTLQKFCAAC